MGNSEKNLLFLFLKNEIKIRQLYELYNKLFPNYGYLWDYLIKEENEHANILEKLTANIDENSDIFNHGDFVYSMVNYVSDFIDKKYTAALDNNLNLKSALETALSIEMSMIEKKCFDVLQPTLSEVQSAFKKLNSGTDNHIHTLKRIYEKNYPQPLGA